MNIPAPVVLQLPLIQVIVPPDRLREVNPERAAAIAVSMTELGQITPIEVGPADADGMHVLTTGAHRVAAARLAKIDTILATVFEGSDDERRLREIDENLYREELTPFDQAAFLAERLDVFRRLHGKLAKGRPPKSGAISHRFLFYAEVEGRFGLSADIVKKALARFEAFSEQERAQLRSLSYLLSGSNLDKLKTFSASERAQVMRRLVPDGNRVNSFADAIREVGGDPDAPETVMERIKRLFLRLAPSEKAEFVAWSRKNMGI